MKAASILVTLVLGSLVTLEWVAYGHVGAWAFLKGLLGAFGVMEIS